MDDNEKLLELNKIMNLINSPKVGDSVFITIKGFTGVKFEGKIIGKNDVAGDMNLKIASNELSRAIKSSKIPVDVQIDTIEHKGIKYNPNGKKIINNWKKI